MTTRALPLLALSLTIQFLGATHIAFAQATLVGKNCDLSALGATDANGFLAFDRELRDAAAHQDPGKMSLLVNFPLRVNDTRGSFYLHDAASLQGRFQEAFPAEVRQAISKENLETITCLWSGVMYGDGAVWVEFTDRGYAINAINLPLRSGAPEHSRVGDLKFACKTARRRVIVDIGLDGMPRYRAWDKPHALTDSPDLVITKGTAHTWGTGLCAYTGWTFEKGETSITLDQLGCFPDSNQPPQGARGTLGISTEHTDSTPWCF